MLQTLNKFDDNLITEMEYVSRLYTLKKGTWSGCVFNMVGNSMGVPQRGQYDDEVLTDSNLRATFIREWDSNKDYSTDDLNRDLRTIMEERNLIPKIARSRVRRVITERQFNSTLLTLEELETMEVQDWLAELVS